jgi:O-acetyl-ADP-ribose deacetylase (regulator of RNase III)
MRPTVKNMNPITFYLRGHDGRLVEQWKKWFAEFPEVIAEKGDIFGIQADAIISPANCFGFMDGGIDLAYSKKLGWHVQDRLRTLLREHYDGELPIGLAVLIETDYPAIPFLISAPTMRAPTNVSNTLNAYLAFRAALRVIKKQNEKSPGSITSVLCPGLATGTGEMLPEICAKQMHAAYIEIMKDQPRPPASVNEAILEHYRLLRIED